MATVCVAAACGGGQECLGCVTGGIDDVQALPSRAAFSARGTSGILRVVAGGQRSGPAGSAAASSFAPPPAAAAREAPLDARDGMRDAHGDMGDAGDERGGDLLALVEGRRTSMDRGGANGGGGRGPPRLVSRESSLIMDDAIAAARDARVAAMGAIYDVASALQADARAGREVGDAAVGAPSNDADTPSEAGAAAAAAAAAAGVSGRYQDIHGVGARAAAAVDVARGAPVATTTTTTTTTAAVTGGGGSGGSMRAGLGEGAADLRAGGDWGDGALEESAAQRDADDHDSESARQRDADGRDSDNDSYAGGGGRQASEAVLYDPAVQSVESLMITPDSALARGPPSSYIDRGARESEAMRQRWRQRTVADIRSKTTAAAAAAAAGGAGAGGDPLPQSAGSTRASAAAAAAPRAAAAAAAAAVAARRPAVRFHEYKYKYKIYL